MVVVVFKYTIGFPIPLMVFLNEDSAREWVSEQKDCSNYFTEFVKLCESIV